jgi:hypothetical protein
MLYLSQIVTDYEHGLLAQELVAKCSEVPKLHHVKVAAS